MDRCRCEEYHAAVEKLRFYTVGTYRPDIIDNFDRSGYTVGWIKNGISPFDPKFLKPKGYKLYKPQELPENQMSHESRKVEQMWCPFMTPINR